MRKKGKKFKPDMGREEKGEEYPMKTHQKRGNLIGLAKMIKEGLRAKQEFLNTGGKVN